MKHRVDGHANLYKDSDSGVISNRGVSDRSRYRIAKEQALKNLNTEQEVADLKSEIKELKELVRRLM